MRSFCSKLELEWEGEHKDGRNGDEINCTKSIGRAVLEGPTTMEAPPFTPRGGDLGPLAM